MCKMFVLICKMYGVMYKTSGLFGREILEPWLPGNLETRALVASCKVPEIPGGLRVPEVPRGSGKSETRLEKGNRQYSKMEPKLNPKVEPWTEHPFMSPMRSATD